MGYPGQAHQSGEIADCCGHGEVRCCCRKSCIGTAEEQRHPVMNGSFALGKGGFLLSALFDGYKVVLGETNSRLQ